LPVSKTSFDSEETAEYKQVVHSMDDYLKSLKNGKKLVVLSEKTIFENKQVKTEKLAETSLLD
jgi:hypothetical protein